MSSDNPRTNPLAAPIDRPSGAGPTPGEPREDRGVRRGFATLEHFERHARSTPHRPAVVEIDDRGEVTSEVTYNELGRNVRRHEDSLHEHVPAGGAVLLLMPSGAEMIAWLAAGLRAGLRVLPIHPQAAQAEIERAARVSGARQLVRGTPTNYTVRIDTLAPNGSKSIRSEKTGPEHRPDATGSLVLSSSGTTGLPKHVLREASALDADAANVSHGMGLSRDDALLAAMPLCHSYGIDIVLAALHAGCALHVLRALTPRAVAEQVRRHATVVPGMPFIYELLLREEPCGSARVRLALSAGSPLPMRLRDRVARAWGLRVGQLYGATELGTVAIADPGRPGYEDDSIGAGLPGVSFRVVDPRDPDRVLPAGQEGMLAVAAPSMLTRYLDGEVDRHDGHWLSGDLAVMNHAGCVRLTGRQKLLIDVGGYKVNPLEVERALLGHSGLAACVIVPVDASDTVQRLRAVCVAEDPDRPPTAGELRSFLRPLLSPVKIPRVFDFVGILPRGSTGKILRDQL